MDQNPYQPGFPPSQTPPYQPPASPVSVPPQAMPSLSNPWQSPTPTPAQPAPAPVAPAWTNPQPAPQYQAPQPSAATYAPPSLPPQPQQAAYTAPAPIAPQPQGPALPPQSDPRLRHLRRRMIMTMVAVGVFMVGGTALLMGISYRDTLSGNGSTSSSDTPSSAYDTTNFRTYDRGGVVFDYPNSWVPVTSTQSGVVAEFADKADVNQASVLLTFASQNDGYQALSSYTDTQITAFENDFEVEVQSSSFANRFKTDSGCVTVDPVQADLTPDWYTLKGVKYTFSCKRANGQSVEAVGYIGLANSGSFDAFQIAKVGSLSSADQEYFDTILSGLVVD